MARARKCVDGQLGGDVDECARHGGDRDAPEEHRVLGIEETAAMRLDSLNAPLGRRCDLRRRRRPLHQPMQIRGRKPTQKRTFACCQDRGQVSGFDAGCPVPDPVDAAVLAEQGSALNARPDLLRRHTRIEQLRAGDDPMRRARNPRQFSFDCPALRLHTNR
jgi:hypothetical protein